MRTRETTDGLRCRKRLAKFYPALKCYLSKAEWWLYLCEHFGGVGENANLSMWDEAGNENRLGAFVDGGSNDGRRKTLPNGELIIDLRRHSVFPFTIDSSSGVFLH